jgi:hypothetical protein
MVYMVHLASTHERWKYVNGDCDRMRDSINDIRPRSRGGVVLVLLQEEGGPAQLPEWPLRLQEHTQFALALQYHPRSAFITIAGITPAPS